MKIKNKNPFKILSRVMALALCAGMLLCCACRRGEQNGPEINGGSIEELLPTAEPTRAPASGGILHLPMPVNAPHDDPLNVNTEEMLYLFSLVYDELITVKENGELTPCLCESWQNEGGGVWLLHLRESAKWQDGSGRLTAQNVVDTYTDLCQMPDSYYFGCTRHIVSMQAQDPSTVKVTMDIPGIIALYSLCFPIRKAGAELMGTGAYRKTYIGEDAITLNANSDWWDRKPYINTVIFEERDSNETALASYEAGQLNMVPTNILTAGKYAQKGETNVLDVMTQGMEVLMFNNASVFGSAEMRRAVAQGINRSRIITNVYMNRARASDVPVPADSWLYDSRSAVLNYDPAAASAAIAELGYTLADEGGVLMNRKNGQRLSLRLLTSATTENTTRLDAANIIASQLSELGFEVQVVTAEHTVGDEKSPFVEALEAGDWDIALVGFNLALDCDPAPYITPGGACSYSSIGDPQLVKLSEALLKAGTEEELRTASYEFQAAFVESVPFITLYFRLNSIVYSADILGLDSAREPDLMADIKDWYFAG